MNTTDRRKNIMNILIFRRRTTAKELAEELDVTTRTIMKDIQALSPEYPIYTRLGGNGGIFINDDYQPYNNTLTAEELKELREVYGESTGKRKRMLFQILKKYGPSSIPL